MPKTAALLLIALSVSLSAQSSGGVGDHATPVRPVASTGNTGVSNATLFDESQARVLRVVVEGGGKRVMHTHDDVQFHLFVPISGAMQLDLDGGRSVTVTPWRPYMMQRGTMHGFHNEGSAPVEILEVFVKTR